MVDRKRDVVARVNGNGKHASVKRADFVKDPGRYVDQARDEGPVTITDANGKPRAMIVIPKAITPYPVE